jgi:lipid II:glycine glycyltransferase (peptidoglycan interpeptide bridge formation enzyme)
MGTHQPEERPDMSLTLRTISREQHLAYMQSLPSASHMQVPAWADVKAEWRSENLGWFDKSGQLVGVGLVLYRQLPKIKRYLAYLPEGPVINWYAPNLDDWIQPMLAHLKQQGAFSVKMGPPVIIRRWEAASIKQGIQNPDVKRLRAIEADHIEPRAFEVADKLRRMGWQQGEDGGAGFGDVQPRYVFQVPLENRSLDDVQKGFNQLWRRNIKKAEKAGVEVVQGGYDDLPVWQQLYEVTAERDHFRPRPLPYFQRMWQVLNAEDPNRMRLYFAQHEGEAVAAATMLVVGRHVWYSYGASANHKREVRPSNAMQWRMLRDAYALGASVYDLRGISDSLDETDHLFGLIQFKVGTGGQAADYQGEFDYTHNKNHHNAIEIYMSRR